MNPNPLRSLADYSHFVAEVVIRTTIDRSTVIAWSDSPQTGIAEGEIFFRNGCRLRLRELVSERVHHEQRVTASWSRRCAAVELPRRSRNPWQISSASASSPSSIRRFRFDEWRERLFEDGLPLRRRGAVWTVIQFNDYLPIPIVSRLDHPMALNNNIWPVPPRAPACGSNRVQPEIENQPGYQASMRELRNRLLSRWEALRQ